MGLFGLRETQKVKPAIKGRGSPENPSGRFERIDFVADEDAPSADGAPKTVYYKDRTKTIISYNQSPDVSFDASINPYRGCEHGCVYCYARPTHEYLGLSAGLDFETKIFVKQNAPELLRKELRSARWVPKPIAISGVTDCYQPAEKHFLITRKCLKVLREFRNPVGIVTKSYLVTRDLDILSDMAEIGCASVIVSVTTLDGELSRKMEPRASQPEYRLKAIARLADAGIPVTVLIAPVIPGLTDHEIPAIMKETSARGAVDAGYVMLRLPYGVADIFSTWLERHYPDRKKKILGRIESMRDGSLNSSEYRVRMKGKGIFAEQTERIFRVAYGKFGFSGRKATLDVSRFRRDGAAQLELF